MIAQELVTNRRPHLATFHLQRSHSSRSRIHSLDVRTLVAALEQDTSQAKLELLVHKDPLPQAQLSLASAAKATQLVWVADYQSKRAMAVLVLLN